MVWKGEGVAVDLILMKSGKRVVCVCFH
jgi:hypothetical protein